MERRRHRWLHWTARAGSALLLALGIAAPADARKFQMSGTWLMRKGQSFIPLQFAGAFPGPDVSMGLLTEVMTVDPDQVVSAVGGASAAGSDPASVEVPKQFWQGSHGVVFPLFGTMLVQITTMFAVEGPYATATLRGGSGAGDFTWCPSNPACAAGGPLTGGLGNRGRVVYVAGPNRFGGTMQMGLRGGGLVSIKGVGPGVIGHVKFGGSGPALRKLALGAQLGPDLPATEVLKLPPGLLTAPIGGIPASGMLVTMPGPIVGAFPPLPTPMGGLTGQFTTNWAFAHTTGTILVQAETGEDPGSFFVLMGSDARTPLGAGQLSTVAGGLARRNTLGGDTIYAQFDRVTMSFGPPVPSLSPAGFAAAGALLLLATGYAFRRRRA